MRIIHFGIHQKENKNSGDTLLFKVTRDLFEFSLGGQIQWSLVNLWEEVTEQVLSEINENFDLVLIGGGGIFLKDQSGAEASKSGWQWNCASETMKRINTPIVVFGVGYNRFRGQEDFEPEFHRSVNILYEKSIFFGLRNTGSLENIKKYLIGPTDKLSLQHCPTSLLSKIYPVEEILQTDKKVLSFNLAYDRPHYRFGDNEKAILKAMGDFLYDYWTRGFMIDIVLHKHIDEEILNYLPANLRFNLINLTELNWNEILDYYNRTQIVLGMRGHAQLIPFGLNKKILSIITHDKLLYFLQDIKKDWCVDVLDPLYPEKLASNFERIYRDETIGAQLVECQEEIWNQTQANFQQIKRGALAR